MKEIETSRIITIRDSRDYWYAVEDVYIDVGCDGITVSYHEDRDNKRVNHMCFSEEIAVEIARAILKLTNND